VEVAALGTLYSSRAALPVDRIKAEPTARQISPQEAATEPDRGKLALKLETLENSISIRQQELEEEIWDGRASRVARVKVKHPCLPSFARQS
jgi:hypothetical protein